MPPGGVVRFVHCPSSSIAPAARSGGRAARRRDARVRGPAGDGGRQRARQPARARLRARWSALRRGGGQGRRGAVLPGPGGPGLLRSIRRGDRGAPRSPVARAQRPAVVRGRGRRLRDRPLGRRVQRARRHVPGRRAGRQPGPAPGGARAGGDGSAAAGQPGARDHAGRRRPRRLRGRGEPGRRPARHQPQLGAGRHRQPGRCRRRRQLPAARLAERADLGARGLPRPAGRRAAVPRAAARHQDPDAGRADLRGPRPGRRLLRRPAHRLPVPGRRRAGVPGGARARAAGRRRRLHQHHRPGVRARRPPVRPRDRPQRPALRRPDRGSASAATARTGPS